MPPELHHETTLITTIVAGIVLAFLFGAVAVRLRAPALVGYLAAGVMIGPFTPGYVADQALAPQLAELGVILLMFGVGLHFSLADLRAVRSIALPGAVAQISAATALGTGLGLALGWPLAGAAIFGLALSVASTVVMLKALEQRGLIETQRGKIAVGWLIVEDLAMVLALVLIPALASAGDADGGLAIVWAIAWTLIKVVAFVAVMMIVGKRVMPMLLRSVAARGTDELFRVAVLALALGSALGAAELFDVSLALGAFFAGMIIAETEFKHRADVDTLPLRDAFAVLFFVSVGMLFDPASLLRQPLTLLATVAIIVAGKAVVAWVIVTRRPGADAATGVVIAASLAQIGEFSFILAGLGMGLGLLPPEGRDLILGGALASIMLNPAVFALGAWMQPRLQRRLDARG